MILTRAFIFVTLLLTSVLAIESESEKSENKETVNRGNQETPHPTSISKDKGTFHLKENLKPRTITEWINNASALTFFPGNINPGTTPPNAAAGANTGTGTGNNGFFESIFGNNNLGLPGTVGTVAGSAVLIKGGFLTLLTALKSILIPAVLLILVMSFLLAGAAFFTCSLIDCQSSFGALTRQAGVNFLGNDSNSGIGGPVSPFLDDRNTIDYYEHFRPIYQAIDEGHQKYGTPLKGSHSQGHGTLTSGQ